MDPRHPEEAISRMVDLMTQFNLILTDMKHTTVSAQLGQLEREGGLVVQEICLVAPRLHEAMMQVSRNRRHDLSRGVFPEVSAETLKEPTLEAVENYVAPNQAETVIVEPKPRKKKKITKKKKEEKQCQEE